VDLCLVACSAILPAGVVYLEFLGRHAPAWLGRLAGLIAGLWVASLLLRAAELIRVLLVLKRQARALQRAAQTLTLTPSLPPGPRKGLFTGIRYALDAARANEPIRALLLSGSALAFSYFPAIVAFVGVVPGHTAALSTSRAPHSVFVLLVIGLGLFLTSAFMAGAILHPRTRVRALRQAVHDAAYGRSSSEFREELEIGCEIAKNGMRDTGWHERKTTNVGAEPLWWRTLGIGTSDVPAYRYRRFVTPRVNVRGGGPGPSQRIYLVPIGRPFDEGTNPLLEYAAIFDPPIPEGGVISWRVDFDWPEFSSKFRHDDQDMYQATFASWTTRVDFVVWAPCPIDARFDQADSEGTTVEGAGTPRTRCIQRFVAAAPASTRRMFRVKYARAS